MVVFLIGHILLANQIHPAGFLILSDLGYFDVVGVFRALQREHWSGRVLKLIVNRNLCVGRMFWKKTNHILETGISFAKPSKIR